MSAANATAAAASWHGRPPDWVKALAAECDRATQRKVADALGYSPAVINLVLRNRYGNGRGGDLERVAEKVRGQYMGKTVECPVLEEIPRNKCIAYQGMRGADLGVNPTRVQLYRACRNGCPHSLIAKGGPHDQ